MTIPLSRTRSRTSIRLVPPAARSTAIVKAPYSFLSVRSVPCATARRLGPASPAGVPSISTVHAARGSPASPAHGRATDGGRIHQSRPMASALSIEQIMMRMVSSSTSASDTLISPPRRDLCPGRGRGHPPARRFHGSDWLSGRRHAVEEMGPLITREACNRASRAKRARTDEV